MSVNPIKNARVPLVIAPINYLTKSWLKGNRLTWQMSHHFIFLNIDLYGILNVQVEAIINQLFILCHRIWISKNIIRKTSYYIRRVKKDIIIILLIKDISSSKRYTILSSQSEWKGLVNFREQDNFFGDYLLEQK